MTYKPHNVIMQQTTARQQIIGDYLVIDSLGSGATSKVKLGKHQETGKLVAIKIFSKSKFQQNPGLEWKVRRETALMRLFDHPHILKLIEVCESQRHLYSILEHACNGELFECMTRQRVLDLNEAMPLFRQIVYGLDFLHQLGVCHRDLKPENILLDAHNQVKIADFGFARWMKSDVADTTCGSPHYVAPEVTHGKPYDGRKADVWSCGVILYAMIAGKLPFDGPSVRNVIAKVRYGRYQRISTDPNVQDLIYRMLTTKPEERITIDGIKRHPGFLLGLADDYCVPVPLPLPVYPEPVELENADEKILSVLCSLGYGSDSDVRTELQQPYTNMAKVFFHILVGATSLEALPWGGDGGTDCTSDDDFIISSGMQWLQHDHRDADVMTRKRGARRCSPGSPDPSSFAERVKLDRGSASHEPANTNTIHVQDMPVECVMERLQKLIRTERIEYFHPDDLTLITRHDGAMYVITRIEIGDENSCSIVMEQVQGSAIVFGELVASVTSMLYNV